MKRSSTWSSPSQNGMSMIAAASGLAALKKMGIIEELHWPEIPTPREIIAKFKNWLKDKGSNGSSAKRRCVVYSRTSATGVVQSGTNLAWNFQSSENATR